MNVKAELKTIIFDRAVVDLTPQLLEIKNWKPDLFINVGIGTPMYLIGKQAYDVGLIPATPMLISYDAPPGRSTGRTSARRARMPRSSFTTTRP